MCWRGFGWLKGCGFGWVTGRGFGWVKGCGTVEGLWPGAGGSHCSRVEKGAVMIQL